MMKNLTKKRALLFPIFLLMGVFYALHAAKSVYQPIIQLQKGDDAAGLPSTKRKLLVHGYCRTYDIPEEVCLFIIHFVYDKPLQYKNKPLPSDLSGQDLSGFDFTGCQFTYTNLTESNLTNVILTNTTCDYQKAFQDNIKKKKLRGGNWYKENLPKDLKSIAEMYPKLNSDTHKAKLLHIACGISRLPFYENIELYIKMQYWYLALLQLKQVLEKPHVYQRVFLLESDLNNEAKNYCWQTKYPQDKVTLKSKVCHANFDGYLKDLHHGLIQYKCKSKRSWGFDWYKRQITKNIKGLKKAYPNIKSKQLQQAVCNIAHALSKSYQIEQSALLSHYLFYQNSLIRLKDSVDVGVKSDIYYNKGILRRFQCLHSWNAIT